MPKESRIFVLPDYGGFPEPITSNTSPYEAVLPYLHSSTLVWSVPTMKGRFWDNWQVDVANNDPETALDLIIKAGFTGILVDEYGYNASNPSYTMDITKLTGITPLTSKNTRYSFFNLTPYIIKKYSDLNSEQYNQMVQDYLLEVKTIPKYYDGLYGTRIRVGENYFIEN